ncbi:hypothetical protein M8C21_030518 [Ambrosia artemisiifolia]|uniref:Uncharacterized protein n=1 Tax=Ambrosia artemisiifolia TaxID=4212 RepID=A0AAD5G2A3_AMBAR|nr:hypothetical protein M8C21_030518 [Ambrosia artemisiifolia]
MGFTSCTKYIKITTKEPTYMFTRIGTNVVLGGLMSIPNLILRLEGACRNVSESIKYVSYVTGIPIFCVTCSNERKPCSRKIQRVPHPKMHILPMIWVSL